MEDVALLEGDGFYCFFCPKNAEKVVPDIIKNQLGSLVLNFKRELVTPSDERIDGRVRKILKINGWKSPFKVESRHHNFSIDGFRDGVALEFEVRTDRDLVIDLLKLQIGYSLNKMLSGVIITKHENQYSDMNRPYWIELYHWLDELSTIGGLKFTVPLWVIGIDMDEADPQH